MDFGERQWRILQQKALQDLKRLPRVHLIVCQGVNLLLGKPSKKKSGLTMDFFRKGSDPPPLIFGSYGTRGAHLIFGHK